MSGRPPGAYRPPDRPPDRPASRFDEAVTLRMPLEAPATAQRSYSRWRSEAAALAAMAIIFIGCAVAFWGNDDQVDPRPAPPAATVPHSIGELHPAIGSVLELPEDGGVLEITLLQPSPIYPASVVAELCRDALTISQRLHAFFPDTGSATVRFVAKAPPTPAVDGAAAQALIPVLSIDFDRRRLLAEAAPPEASLKEFLGSAVAVRPLNASGRRYLDSFCRDPLGASTAADFCRREDP